MNRLLIPLLIVASANSLAEKKVLDYLYELRASNPTIAEQTLSINQDARDLKFDRALSFLEALTNENSEISNLSKIEQSKLLANLGIIQIASGDHKTGLIKIDQSLSLMSLSLKPFDPTYVNALIAKGISTRITENFEVSEAAFRRAQHIMHRESGIFTLAQLPLIDYLTLNKLKNGQYLSADREQLFGISIVRREFGAKAEPIVPRLMHTGRYFRRRAQSIPISTDADSINLRGRILKSSREMFQETINIYENIYGSDSLKLVAPLRELAKVKLIGPTGRKGAEKDLKKAIAIFSSNDEFDLADLHTVNIELGDFYAITKDERASAQYLETWKRMQESELSRDRAEKLFSKPLRLYPPRIVHYKLDRLPDSAIDNEDLFVELQYDVNKLGKVSAISITGKNVPNDQARLVRELEKRTIYRPQITNGELVDSQENTLRQLFRVNENKIPDKKNGNSTDTKGKNLKNDTV